MRYALTILALCLLSAPALAGDLTVQENWINQPGETYRHQFGNQYQKYDMGVPDLDRQLQRQGDRLQVYDRGIQQPGDFYERQSDGTWQKYENWQPQFGDELEEGF